MELKEGQKRKQRGKVYELDLRRDEEWVESAREDEDLHSPKLPFCKLQCLCCETSNILLREVSCVALGSGAPLKLAEATVRSLTMQEKSADSVVQT